MAEAGLSAKEIQAQSGHSNIETLYGYIQHTSERLRSAYVSVFDDVSEQRQPVEETRQPEIGALDHDHMQQLAFQKYLDGEIDRAMLNKILASAEETSESIVTLERGYQ